ncbi:hypothetical protein M5K25_022271 [Dendrobium thyrsiflorum]|uniref:Uncharacterized protein n=1 Tax=Dendrobium thyrsiflorum TaxID=117978 RepID=A0ABD0U5W5_DENTH
MHIFSKRGGKGTRCGAYDEAGKPPFSVPEGPCTPFPGVVGLKIFGHGVTRHLPCTFFSNVAGGPVSRRRGTCPLTGGFAAKWHRRINGYDSGPSEPGDSPPNGITILWLWPAPVCSPMALNP